MPQPPTAAGYSVDDGSQRAAPVFYGAAPAVSAPNLIDASLPNGGKGTMMCDFSVGAGGNAPSAVDVWPVPGNLFTTVPQFKNAAGQTYANVGVNGVIAANIPSTFQNVSVWIKGDKRTDGERFGYARIELSSDVVATAVGNVWANILLLPFTYRCDGRWRLITMNVKTSGVAGTFVLGTSLINAVRVRDLMASTALTTTAALNAGDTSATLTVAFAATSSPYRVRFSNNEVRTVQLTNGSAAITWAPALTSGATTALVYGGTVNRVGMQANDTVEVGPVYANTAGKPFLFVRGDDIARDQYVARQTIAAPFVGTSGVTIPANTPLSMMQIVEAFGLKLSLFILPTYIGKTGGCALSDLMAMQARGHLIAFQTYYNPIDSANEGMRLLGPQGFNLKQNVYGSISAVTPGTDLLTTANAHRITRAIGGTGQLNQGYPVVFFGTNLPAPLVIDRVYWLRESGANDFFVHNTETESCAAQNPIDITTTGTLGNFDYRWAYSAADESRVVADIRNGQALMRDAGLTGYKHIALNQGAIDVTVEEALMQLLDTGELLSVSLILASGGAAAATFMPRHSVSFTSGGIGVVGVGSQGTTISDVVTVAIALQTDSGADITNTGTNLIAPYVDALVAQGAIGANYHHGMANAISMTNIISFCDRIKLRVDNGLALTGTMADLYAGLLAAGK